METNRYAPDEPIMPTSPTSLRHPGLLQVLAVLCVIAGLMLMIDYPLSSEATGLIHRIDELSLLSGAAVFSAVVIVATLAMFPCWIFSLMAGVLFGVGYGTLIMLTAATTAGLLGMLIARHLMRGRLSRWIDSNDRIAALDGAIADEGWKVVALLRVVPLMPFNVQNYLYGLTRIRTGPYVAATFVFMSPGIFISVYTGHLLQTGLIADGSAPWWVWAVRLAILGGAVGGSVYLYQRFKTIMGDDHHFDDLRKEQPQ